MMSPQPAFILGAGSIVRDAHVPAYREAGISIGGFSISTTPARACSRSGCARGGRGGRGCDEVHARWSHDRGSVIEVP
jgi:hypothetical protein